ncbi:MAG TPA: M20/M25/M40 family metallo-hydrolase [Bauldia sp.]|nr:M20/M25/M40 family metallo-hydrolase [Bauldia sp.]
MTTSPPIDRDRAIATLRGLIRRASVTGDEANVVALLAERLPAAGIGDVSVTDFLPGRPNIWGVRRGTGGGPTLMLVGHTDVVHVRGWRERWAGTDREDPFGAALVDGEVWGRGAGDLKAGIATAIEAVHTLAGTPLKGAIVTAFIGDEESGEPGSGRSAGMKALAAAIDAGEVPKPDFAIYVEPTTLDIYPAQMGFIIADIEVIGRTAYFGTPELGADALKATNAILSALWAHSDEISKEGDHALVGRSFLVVTGIEGGGLIAVPERCRISLIRKLRPGEDLGIARDRIEMVVRGAVTIRDVTVAFSYPAGRDHEVGGTATEVDPGIAPVAMLAGMARAVRPDRGRIAGAPFWSEAPFLVGRGVPTVYFAPGDIRICHSLEERVPVAEYFDGIAILAGFIARYVGVADEVKSQAEQKGDWT